MDLQRFAQERTEEATPRRREQARQKGQVFRSIEVSSALVLLGTFLGLKLVGPGMFRQLNDYMVQSLSVFRIGDWTVPEAQRMLVEMSLTSARLVLPVAGIAAIVGLLANLAQIGFVFSAVPLVPSFSRLNPLEGFQRLFSKRSLAELLKSLAKMGAITYVAYVTIRSRLELFPTMVEMDLGQVAASTAALVMNLIWRIGLLLLVIAAADWFYQRWEYQTSLRMTRQEIKEEFKETEGHPQLKAKIKERQRALARRRMMQDVAKADVVVTNPTHFAVALRYAPGEMDAPTVLAKGQGHIAEKIKEMAREHGVPLVENKPLAQALYKSVEIGEAIPPDLYQAVAEVLAFVYRLKGKVPDGR